MRLALKVQMSFLLFSRFSIFSPFLFLEVVVATTLSRSIQSTKFLFHPSLVDAPYTQPPSAPLVPRSRERTSASSKCRDGSATSIVGSRRRFHPRSPQPVQTLPHTPFFTSYSSRSSLFSLFLTLVFFSSLYSFPGALYFFSLFP